MKFLYINFIFDFNFEMLTKPIMCEIALECLV